MKVTIAQWLAHTKRGKIAEEGGADLLGSEFVIQPPTYHILRANSFFLERLCTYNYVLRTVQLNNEYQIKAFLLT